MPHGIQYQKNRCSRCQNQSGATDRSAPLKTSSASLPEGYHLSRRAATADRVDMLTGNNTLSSSKSGVNGPAGHANNGVSNTPATNSCERGFWTQQEIAFGIYDIVQISSNDFPLINTAMRRRLRNYGGAPQVDEIQPLARIGPSSPAAGGMRHGECQ